MTEELPARFQVVKCECGGQYQRKNKSNHIKHTKRHKYWVENGVQYKPKTKGFKVRNVDLDEDTLKRKKEYYKKYSKDYYDKHYKQYTKKSRAAAAPK